MAPSLPQFSALRLRAYIFRLPLFTRAILFVIALFWLVGFMPFFDIPAWGALIPSEMGIATMYRTNTFPLIHAGFFHMLFNCLALAPLLERFEGEWGTLVTVALFMGREFDSSFGCLGKGETMR